MFILLIYYWEKQQRIYFIKRIAFLNIAAPKELHATYVCVCMYVCLCASVCVCTCVYVCACVCACVCVYERTYEISLL